MLETKQCDEYKRWYRSLNDNRAKVRILRQVDRIRAAEALVGDWKNVGDGVIESRIDYGPGYRIYLSIEGNKLLLLLIGGTKRRQQKDIDRAKVILKEWRERHDREI